MALTLPDSFKNHSIKQNWLFQLYYDNESSFTGLSFYDTKVSSNQYYGAVLNKPSIRESINIETSISSTGNISLSVANFNLNSSNFSSALYGANKYINRAFKVYIQPNNATSINDCLLIYSGKLISASHNVDTVSLQVEAKRPWDGVEIPTVKTDKNNYYPIAYGDYRPNASQGNQNSTSLVFNSNAGIDEYRKRKTLYPIPIEEKRGVTIFALTGDWSQSEKAWAHYYEKSTDTFLPIANDSSNATIVDTANETYKDGKAIKFHQNLLKSSYYKMIEQTEVLNDGPFTWAVNNNAFDGDYINTNTYTQCTISGDFINNKRGYVKYAFPQLTGYPNKLAINLVISGSITLNNVSNTGEIRVQLINKSFGADDVLGYFSLTNAQTSTTELVTGSGAVDISSTYFLSDAFDSDSEWLASGSGWGEGLQFNLKCILQSGSLDGDLEGNFRIYDVAVEVENQLDFTETTKTGKLVASKIIDDIEYVYSGSDGLTDNGWNSNSAITTIIAAHRDLLHRNTSYTNSNTPDNWSAVNSAKDWAIRYWVNEPVELLKVLEKLQYEGGFIFRFNGQGNGEYIFIPDSISVNHTLNSVDLKNIDISLLPMETIVARMDIEYEKHPVSNYVSKISASNSSAISDLLIGTNENKKTIRLDANVSTPASSPSSNPNDDFYTYYDNILGDQKIIVSADIVSPIYYGIDVGDFVAFNTMPVNPFSNSNWSGKNFIVTSVSRQVGKLKCEFREV